MEKRRLFGLIELALVLLSLGVLAVISVSQMAHHPAVTLDSQVRQTLLRIREAIDLYAAHHGELPGQDAALPADLADYFSDGFPASPIGAANSRISYTQGKTTTGDIVPSTGWKYNIDTGRFICNCTDLVATDQHQTYDSL